MDFRLWLENIEPIDVKIKQLKDIIDKNDYMTAPKKMVAAGVPFTDTVLKEFQIAENGIGKDLQNAIYKFLAHVDTVSTAFDPDLPNKIIAILDKVKTNLSFKEIAGGDGGWYFFQVANLDGSENPRSPSFEKLHFKINPDNLKQIYDLAAIIRKNSQFFSEFKVHNDEKDPKVEKNTFAYRRDNFLAYLSELGAKNIAKVKGLFSGIKLEVGQDYRNEKTGNWLSHTETKAIELALEMLKKNPNFKPGSLHYFSVTQVAYLKNKFGIDLSVIPGTPPPPKPPKPPKPPTPPPAPPQKLIIQGEKGEETFDNNRIWGREDIKKILPEKQANFFSVAQFDIKKSNQGWFLWPMPKLANQTIINGKVLAIPTKLNVNDKIGLEGKTGKQIMPFTVKAI